ncbi:hypothetical protein N8480_05700 [Flavobacteriaceae bacterium]|jgi:hypothetical protein|nr:hypothetical protein [Flavobacteriaceae bacterium]
MFIKTGLQAQTPAIFNSYAVTLESSVVELQSALVHFEGTNTNFKNPTNRLLNGQI